jgi:deoxyadenosine/deoxycytidine kinase
MWLERKKTPLVYCLVGMIGVGKSTTGELLSKTYIKGKKIIYIPEPVDLWEKCGLLAKYYASFKIKNKKELYEPLLFQMVAISTRLITMKKIMDENPDADIIILDSSIDVDRRVFTKMLIDTERIPKDEVVFYDLSFNNWKNFFIPDFKITRNIYLDADVEKCVSRKNDRDRKSEEKVGAEYLSELKTYFDGFIQQSDIYPMHKSVSANGDHKSVVEQIKSIISDDIKIQQLIV